MKMWKTTNPSSWFLAGMVWFINNICLTVCEAGRRQTGELYLNLASSAGLPADFPLDAADFANFPGTADKLDKIFSKICSAA